MLKQCNPKGWILYAIQIHFKFRPKYFFECTKWNMDRDHICNELYERRRLTDNERKMKRDRQVCDDKTCGAVLQKYFSPSDHTHTHTRLPCQITPAMSIFQIWHLQDRQRERETAVGFEVNIAPPPPSLRRRWEIKAAVKRSLRATEAQSPPLRRFSQSEHQTPAPFISA